MPTRLIQDIGDHFSDRLIDVTADTLDTCRRAGASYKDARAMIAAILAVHLAGACEAFKLPTDSFMELCAMAAKHRLDQSRRKPAARGSP